MSLEQGRSNHRPFTKSEQITSNTKRNSQEKRPKIRKLACKQRGVNNETLEITSYFHKINRL
jgi:hypothetical protein